MAEQQPSTLPSIEQASADCQPQECIFRVTMSFNGSVKFDKELAVVLNTDDAGSRFCGWVQKQQDKISEAISGAKAELDTLALLYCVMGYSSL